MPSIRHHLTIAEAHLTATRAHLESAFEHTTQQHYDPRWTILLDNLITENALTALQVGNVRTLIEPPATAPGMPPCNLSTPHEP